jgi:uncharacterized protein
MLPMAGFSLFPKDKKFFAYFEQQSSNIVQMAQQLRDLVYVWENVNERVGFLADMEQDGDAIKHDIAVLMHRSFLPPLDREDISELTNALDNIADSIHDAADRLYLYNVERPGGRARELVDLIVQATMEVEAGICEIKDKISQPQLLTRSMAINQIENSGDAVYRAALVELFINPKDMASVVKWREIYKKMESAIDGCEVIANILEALAAKYC